jgi:transposase
MLKSMHDADRYDAYQRVEVITGGRRRRAWSDDEKARIVAESADPDVNISEVARRNGVSRGLLTVWRRLARVSSTDVEPFVRLQIEGSVAEEGTVASGLTPAMVDDRIEIQIGDATVRVPVGVDAKTLTNVVAALRSAR